MDRPFPVVTIASCFALAGFAVAVFAGLAADRTASGVLGASLVAMTACYVVGMGAARIAEVAMREHVALVHATAASGSIDTTVTDGSDVDIIGDLPEAGTGRT